jgi:hypothetical protein
MLAKSSWQHDIFSLSRFGQSQGRLKCGIEAEIARASEERLSGSGRLFREIVNPPRHLGGYDIT